MHGNVPTIWRDPPHVQYVFDNGARGASRRFVGWRSGVAGWVSPAMFAGPVDRARRGGDGGHRVRMRRHELRVAGTSISRHRRTGAFGLRPCRRRWRSSRNRRSSANPRRRDRVARRGQQRLGQRQLSHRLGGESSAAPLSARRAAHVALRRHRPRRRRSAVLTVRQPRVRQHRHRVHVPARLTGHRRIAATGSRRGQPHCRAAACAL